MKSALQRFENKFIPEPNSGCWLWTEGCTRLGYGMMHFEGKNRSAHRLSYLFYKGGLPAEKQVNHSCDIRCCVNPDHLVLGSHLENMQASSTRKRYPDRRGEENLQAKLTDPDIRAIRAAPLLNRGDMARLARQYGIHASLIPRIKAIKAWAHVK